MSQQWIRKASLVVHAGGQGLDLSDLHFRFRTVQSDFEGPNTCEIRVYNLATSTISRLREFTQVVLQAGYESNYGVIFSGTLLQYRIGRESPTNTYVDLLVADGDIAYNFATVSTTLAAGSSSKERLDAVIGSMGSHGVAPGYAPAQPTGGVLPRGKVLFGMSRDFMRDWVRGEKCAWNISDGKVNVVPLDSYLPGQAVVLNAMTGMVGRAEQTETGLEVQCLLNPLLRIAGRVQIDNASVNQLIQRDGGQMMPYDKWAGVQMMASISTDGFYRILVVEHEGDTRGQAWNSRLICLALDPSTGKPISKE